MTIRRMVFKDLPQILPLAEQLGYKCSIRELEERFASLVTDPAVGLFVGEKSNRVMAFMQIQEASTLMTGRRAELNAIVIDEAYRGKGAGKAMMSVAEDWVRTRNLPKLRLGSRTSRTDTHEFYKRIGFTVEKSWFIFSKPVESQQ